MEEHVESMLRGGQFRNILGEFLENIRIEYHLKTLEMEVLYYLSKEEDKNTSKDIIKFLNMNKGHISSTLESLTKKELVCSKQDPFDRRVRRFEVTDKAKDIIEKINYKVEAFNRELFVDVKEEEKQIFARVMGKIQNNMERIKREM